MQMKQGKIQKKAAGLTVIFYVMVATSYIPNSIALPSIDAAVSSTVTPLNVAIPESLPLEMELVSEGHARVYQEVGDLYVVTDPNDPQYLKVIEKLPEGGMGRMLRYRGVMEDGNWVDLEFIYEDHDRTLTVLDYKAGLFYRSTFKGKEAEPFAVFPLKEIKDLTGDLTATQGSWIKFVSPKGETGSIEPEVAWLIPNRTILFEKDEWSKRKIRGPPAGGLAS